MNLRWLDLFGAQAPRKSTDAYRTAAEVTADEMVLVAPPVHDDVEAPPVMVRVGDAAIGPDEILPPARKYAVAGIAFIGLGLAIGIVLLAPR